MTKISNVSAMEVLDSRGNPTLKCYVRLSNGSFGEALVPSGASTGKHEAVELRDGGKRYHGKGVKKAVANVNKAIAKKINGMDAVDQEKIDETLIALDGTANKHKLGANALLGVSMAVARAAAMSENKALFQHLADLSGFNAKYLPVPFANVLNGGKHAGGSLKIQEFMVAPVGAKSFPEATQMVSEIYHSLKKELKKKYGAAAVNVGDEGGFAPNIQYPANALEMLQNAIDSLGYTKEVHLALDCAASEFYSKGKYAVEEGKALSADELIDYYSRLLKKYKIVSIEDPFDEDDFNAFSKFLKKFPKLQIVGDDLLVTNVKRIQTAIKKKSCNSLLLKVNQIGTVTESIEAAKLAVSKGWSVMVSHRSGETLDSFISDLSVALNSGQIKLGAPARGERTAKYNRLFEIASENYFEYKWLPPV